REHLVRSEAPAAAEQAGDDLVGCGRAVVRRGVRLVERVPRAAEEQEVGVPEIPGQPGARARGDGVELDVEGGRALVGEEVVDERVVPRRSAEVARADEEGAAGSCESRLGCDRPPEVARILRRLAPE